MRIRQQQTPSERFLSKNGKTDAQKKEHQSPLRREYF